MDLPAKAVTLEVPQLEELARHLSTFRHDVNGCLALVVAASELIRYNPDVVKRMANTLVEQPPKIAGKVREFVDQCERAVGLRDPAQPSWHAALWKRANLSAGQPAAAVSLPPEEMKALHTEVMQLGKELTQLGFFLSGARAFAAATPAHAAEAVPVAGEQFTKVALKFDQMATKFEAAMQLGEAAERRQMGGTPSGPVTLTEDQIALFQRQLMNFQNDMIGLVEPLIELGRLAKQTPQQLQTRAAEFAPASPNISSEMGKFATLFDKTFGIARGAQSH